MNRFFYGCPALLLSLMLVTSNISVAAQPSITQTAEGTTISFRRFLRRLFPDDESEDPPTTSRGSCFLTPARMGSETVTWHQRPVFIWQGNIGKMEVQDTVADTVLWRYQPTADETHVRYDGEPLQSGRTYHWNIYTTAESDSATAFPAFRLLPAASRALLTNGLAIAEEEAPDVHGGRELARAQYFVDRQQPLDALQEIFLVENPDIEFIEARQELINSLCQ